MASALPNNVRAAPLPRKALDVTHALAMRQITYKQAINWIEAIDFARFALNQPLTIKVTIQWLLAPSAMPEPERVKTLLNDIGIWIRRRTQHSAVWIYYRDGGAKTGVILHLLVHVPPSLIEGFTTALTGWIKPRTDHFDPCAVRVDGVFPSDIDALKSLIFAESDERTCEACSALSQHCSCRTGYLIPGKRLGISHSINAPARTRHATPSEPFVEALAPSTQGLAEPPNQC